MEILVDTHTHTVLSGHAHSTMIENATFAAKKGMQGLVTADHGPALAGSAPEFLTNVLLSFPDYMEGIRMFRGAEVNIIDYEGNVDIREKYLKLTEFAVASLHEITIKPGSVEENTCAAVEALKNPYVDIAGHMDRGNFELDRETLVKQAKNLGKLIEINNHSFELGDNAKRTNELISLCKKYNVGICVSSDAHIAYMIGGFYHATAALEENNFPEELIINRNLETFTKYLKDKKRI